MTMTEAHRKTYPAYFASKNKIENDTGYRRG